MVVAVSVRWPMATAVRHGSKGPAGETVGPWVIDALLLVVVVFLVSVVAAAEEGVSGPLVLEVCDEVPKGRGLVVVAYRWHDCVLFDAVDCKDGKARCFERDTSHSYIDSRSLPDSV